MAALLPNLDPHAAIMTLSIFVPASLAFGYTVVRKIQRRRFKATTVEVPGGVKLRASSSRILIIAVAVGTPFAAILFLGDEPLFIDIVAGFMFGVSVFLIGCVLTGRVARRFIRFDPQGLTIGETKFEYQVSWDDMVDIGEVELYGNSAVGFDIASLDAIKVTPESARARAYKTLGNNKGLVNRHVMIVPLHFATNAESLIAALRNYSSKRSARAALIPKPALT